MGWKLSDIPGPHNREFGVEQATAAPGEKRNVRLYEIAGTIEAIDADMLEVSAIGDEPGSRHVRGVLRIRVKTRAGSIPVPWELTREPKIGDRIRVIVEDGE